MIMNTEIMLDLETLGLSPNAVIATIGACKFSEGAIVDEFYAKVDTADCVKRGLKSDPATVDWWKRRPIEANREVFAGLRVSLLAALESFASWMGEDQPIWGNGSDFDNVILSEAFRAVGLTRPWSFWNNRCYRTAMSILPKVDVKITGIRHHALHDARYQALCLMHGCELSKNGILLK
jgi:hypothetical protein